MFQKAEPNNIVQDALPPKRQDLATKLERDILQGEMIMLYEQLPTQRQARRNAQSHLYVFQHIFDWLRRGCGPAE